ncbi:RNA polymerase subunit sigma-70 [Aliifodinibius salipaludis]|uniref:RNA polymerase subunit sigma-70 n=1 Tax=Fodinibius salipaludis TaxID=2032627 RepID=A0A2A2G9W4_9BACT|nr:sigma-70 family RNA polymerase sigma factor [Aliifodinibius salipaludis]PAU93635.1 RNA polymerase subunit sigma-70 [Aliifodinibius salipaludis]
MSKETRVTKLLQKVQAGSEQAYDELFPIVYQELKRLAFSKLKSEDRDITVSETALVHEVYLKMIDQTSLELKNKNHFFAIAARCMRQILVDHARKKKAEKRGGDQKDVTYIDELLKAHQESKELINLDKKLDELAQLDERMADVVTLRYFGQMTVHQTAKALDVSERTVKRDWAKARGWLYKELKKE